MRIRHIEVVNAIYLTGTVSAAAKLLNLTQPAVTQILKSAELQLGYNLFQRIHGRLVPSKEARALFPEIEKLTKQLGTVNRLAENLRSGSGYRLSVLCAPALAQTVLPMAVSKFIKKHPDADLSIRVAYSWDIVAHLALHEADVGIVYKNSPHAAIIEEELAESHLMCITLPGIFSPHKGIPLRELTGSKMIFPDYRDPASRLLTQAYQEAHVKPPKHFTVQSYHAMLEMVKVGIGIGIVDAFTALSINNKCLDAFSIKPRITFPVIAVYAATKERSLLVRDLVQYCREVFAESLLGIL